MCVARRARLAPGAHRLLSSQPNEPCSVVLGQGRRWIRRSSWTDLRPVTERAASAAVRRCCSVGTVPVRRATPFLTSTSMRASLSSGRLSSAFLMGLPEHVPGHGEDGTKGVGGGQVYPVKSEQRRPVPVTRPMYGLHGAAWRRVMSARELPAGTRDLVSRTRSPSPNSGASRRRWLRCSPRNSANYSSSSRLASAAEPPPTLATYFGSGTLERGDRLVPVQLV